MEEKVCRDGSDIIWLVVWNIFYFPYIGNNNPNWLSYFSEGLKPSTTFVLPCSFFFASPNEKNKTVLNGKIRNKINHGVIFPIFCSSYPQIHPDFIQFVFFRDGVIYPISIHIPSSCLPVQHQSRWWLPASDLALWRGITDRDAGGFVKETDEKPSQESGWKRRRHLCSVGTEWNGKKPVSLGTLPSQSAEGCWVWLTVVYEIYLSVTLV